MVSKESVWYALGQLHLVLLSSNEKDVLSICEKGLLPKSFPSRFADHMYLKWLEEQEIPKLEAGLEVIAERKYEALFLLKTLDQNLSSYISKTKNEQNKSLVLSYRNQLRLIYKKISTTIVENLFAKRLLGEDEAVASLLNKIQAKPYLSDSGQLQELLRGHSREVAWSRFIQPILISEINFLETNTSNPIVDGQASFQIEANSRKVLGDEVLYEGAVSVVINQWKITCDSLRVKKAIAGDSFDLKGESARILGLPTFNTVQTKAFTLNTVALELQLMDGVRLQSQEKIKEIYSCLVSAKGEIKDDKSLSNAFATLKNIDKKIAFVKNILNHYAVKDLPDEAIYIYALLKLNEIVTWHEGVQPQIDRIEEKSKVGNKNSTRFDPFSPWEEAHSGESWLWPEAYRKAEDAGIGYYENSEMSQELRPLYWRLKSGKDVEVSQLLEALHLIKGEAYLDKARKLQSDIERNNTVLTLDVPGFVSRKNAEKILPKDTDKNLDSNPIFVLDARNVDQLDLKI